MRGTSSARRRASKHGFLSALLGASVVVTSTVVALPGSFVIAAHAASSGQPNLFDPNSAATSVNHLPPEPAPEANPTPGTPTPFMKNPTVFNGASILFAQRFYAKPFREQRRPPADR